MRAYQPPSHLAKPLRSTSCPAAAAMIAIKAPESRRETRNGSTTPCHGNRRRARARIICHLSAALDCGRSAVLLAALAHAGLDAGRGWAPRWSANDDFDALHSQRG